MSSHRQNGFTLIELLVVIAIIAILAAILFPVFAQVREKARQITCVSNAKQLALGYIQYAQDYDEAVPIAFYKTWEYGPVTAKYNTTTDINGKPIGGAFGQPTGIPAQLQPYIKSWDAFKCPDDPIANQVGDVKVAGLGETLPELSGMTFFQIYGTSYLFTPEVESDPFREQSETGYTQVAACTNGTTNSSGDIPPGNAKECDLVASGETINPNAGGTWTPNGSDQGHDGFGVVTLSVYTRPTETRIFHEWNLSFQGSPVKALHTAFHQNGSTMGFEDGHAKFITKLSDYNSGCDGTTWAWDVAGSCNTLGLQRNKD
jgi:prepilin-type N-terminal cleavage/methylation domain-containing protein